MIQFIVFTILTFLIYHFLRQTKKRPSHFPPGPPTIPLLGNALQLGMAGHKEAFKLEGKYGPIVGVYLGSYKAIILNNIDDIRSAFAMPEFGGRYGYNAMLHTNPGESNIGVMMSEGPMWLAQRKFCVKAVRDFGFGRVSEPFIVEEVNKLITRLKKLNGSSFSTQDHFSPAIFNVISQVLNGRRYNYDDPRLIEVIHFFDGFVKSVFKGETLLCFLFPWAVTLSNKFNSIFVNSKQKSREKYFEFLDNCVQSHRDTIQLGHPRDLIDAYLEESMKKENLKSPDSSFNFHDDFGLKVLIMDIFLAGTETTTVILSWAFFLLALHPLVQDKMYKEIKTVVGQRPVSLEDRPNLPYMEATTTETLRCANMVPFVFRSTTKDVFFKGYQIPKNTKVIGNLYAVHMNKKTWGDPGNFKPERFLFKSNSGQFKFVGHRSFRAFGSGQRICVGESLARNQIFLFLANCVQNFVIKMAPGEPMHSMEPQFGGVQTPEPHKIVLLDRN